jgi:NADH-quinone oxidoreductase subunit A
MGTEFTPIFVFILVAIMVAVGMLAASAVLGPRRVTPVKQMPYESGMDPIGDARQRFDVRYYLVAIVFLLFDVELLFLYPWAVAQWSRDLPASPAAVAHAAATAPAATPPIVAGILPELRNLVFGEILVFIAILAAAFAYAWRKGVFEWR